MKHCSKLTWENFHVKKAHLLRCNGATMNKSHYKLAPGALGQKLLRQSSDGLERTVTAVLLGINRTLRRLYRQTTLPNWMLPHSRLLARSFNFFKLFPTFPRNIRCAAWHGCTIYSRHLASSACVCSGMYDNGGGVALEFIGANTKIDTILDDICKPAYAEV